jgi:UDP-glucose 4-epimerase
MKILLTGGAGFIAGHIAQKYLESGYQVFILDKKPEKLLRQDLIGKVEYFCQDLTQKGVNEIFAKVKPDIVNHHAALISVPESQQIPVKYEENNVLATINLLELAQIHDLNNFFLLISSSFMVILKNFPIKKILTVILILFMV